jgi:HSP20 family molecular chaperone IbpA
MPYDPAAPVPVLAAERADSFLFRIELPPVSEDTVDLALDAGGTFRVSGGAAGQRFERSFRLPIDADAERVTAIVADGAVRVVVPKRLEALLLRRAA